MFVLAAGRAISIPISSPPVRCNRGRHHRRLDALRAIPLLAISLYSTSIQSLSRSPPPGRTHQGATPLLQIVVFLSLNLFLHLARFMFFAPLIWISFSSVSSASR